MAGNTKAKKYPRFNVILLVRYRWLLIAMLSFIARAEPIPASMLPSRLYISTAPLIGQTKHG
jgi:hypothetical protein